MGGGGSQCVLETCMYIFGNHGHARARVQKHGQTETKNGQTETQRLMEKEKEREVVVCDLRVSYDCYVKCELCFFFGEGVERAGAVVSVCVCVHKVLQFVN